MICIGTVKLADLFNGVSNGYKVVYAIKKNRSYLSNILGEF